ncbi:MAG: methylmalonyl-CoA mutase family protein [Bacteroidota bacterium]
MSSPEKHQRDPWIIRTYAGFGNADDSNRRFHENLKKGQTGLSVAFDLPTQNGYDPDAPMARGEVGGCGVSIAHIGDMENLFRGIAVGMVNTSMTINAPAPFLLALYLVLAERQQVAWTELRGTVQNDLMKEFVARGTSIFSPETSLRLSCDLITFSSEHVPNWNPINMCGYHYMESGARPQEEIGYAFGNALLVLDRIRPQLSHESFEKVVRRISFFINSGIELVPEICKMRAYSQLWANICREEYGIDDVKFRAGCQVRSLSLTAAQPENNIIRIALEALPVILSANARVNALQLPGFREALSLPDEMEQTLSLRTQQILMHETKIDAYPDIFEGNPVIESLTAQYMNDARTIAQSMRSIGYTESIQLLNLELTKAFMERQRRIESGDDIVVGVNKYTEPVGLAEQLTPAPSTAQGDDFGNRRHQEIGQWREKRDHVAFERAKDLLRAAVTNGENIMPPTIGFVKAGGTVGEWTSVIEHATQGRYSGAFDPAKVSSLSAQEPTGEKLRIVLGKAGLDGHNNAIKILALACRNAGHEVIFAGIKLSAEALMKVALEEDASILGVSCSSGAHLTIAADLVRLRSAMGLESVRLVLGGTIPERDISTLYTLGIDIVVSDTAASMSEIVKLITSPSATSYNRHQ